MALPYNQRTRYCGEYRAEHIGESVIVTGWVNKWRDHGDLVFIDLRDRTGLVQLKFDPTTDPKAHAAARQLRNEFCIVARGDVRARPEGFANPKLPTGEIEIITHQLEVLSAAEVPRFEIKDDLDVNEDLRLQYRYLDLRRPVMQHALQTRHRIAKEMRDFFDEERFLEIETPFLTKSTPEGARDYLVPSRVNPGMFYALPQSPQIFKQLLMMSGFDRYVQIVRCFRDEDLRADRQPEFTQLDLEMSFVQPEDVMDVVERCLARVMRVIHGVDIPTPFPRMNFADAMRDYGIDRPDTRYDLRIRDVGEVARRMDFRIFTSALEAGGAVRCIRLPRGAEMTRKETDGLTEEIKGIGAGGLPLVKIAGERGSEKFETGIAKFFDEQTTRDMVAATEAEPGDLLFFAAGSASDVSKYLSWLRGTLARRRALIPENQWNFLWVTNFPMFEYNVEDGRYYSMHHPFTAPMDEDLDKLETDPTACRAKAYDVVLNGIELGGGSIRIHRQAVQEKVFELLQLTREEQQAKFGFLLEALKYGPPPHGGIALGLDRLVMLLTGQDNIRDTFSFPKTQRATDPMSGAPSPVDPRQLAELNIELVRPPEPGDAPRH